MGAVCPSTPTSVRTLDPNLLRRHSPCGRGKQLLSCSLAGKCMGCEERQGLPYGVSLRLPLDTRQRCQLRRNGVKGGLYSPFILTLDGEGADTLMQQGKAVALPSLPLGRGVIGVKRPYACRVQGGKPCNANFKEPNRTVRCKVYNIIHFVTNCIRFERTVYSLQ